MTSYGYSRSSYFCIVRITLKFHVFLVAQKTTMFNMFKELNTLHTMHTRYFNITQRWYSYTNTYVPSILTSGHTELGLHFSYAWTGWYAMPLTLYCLYCRVDPHMKHRHFQ